MSAEHAAARGRLPIVLIDGPSGSGKSTLADALLASWPGPGAPQLVRLDDLYPGWGGLDAGSQRLVDELLLPLSAGREGRWRRHDWVRDAPAEWHLVTPDRPVIVEGCGAISRASAPLAMLRVWLGADDTVRKERALRRDAGAFDAHWDEWDAQFERFLAREHPTALADLLLDGTIASPSTLEAVRTSLRSMSGYIVEYLDGPLQGQTDRRDLIDGAYEQDIDAYVAVDGLDTQLHYLAVESRTVGETLFVGYRFDAAASDPYTVDDEDSHIGS